VKEHPARVATLINFALARGFKFVVLTDYATNKQFSVVAAEVREFKTA
jgi:hypothetical protein